MPDLRQPPPPPPLWNWSGVYIGGHLGGGLGLSQFPDTAGAGIYGGQVRTPTVLGGMQVGINWQAAPHGLIGVEADISAADGTHTCSAASGLFASANCRIHQYAMATVTGRAGLITGPSGLTLLHAKGGAAPLREKVEMASMPGDWLSQAAHPILVEFCRQTCRARLLEMQVARFEIE